MAEFRTVEDAMAAKRKEAESHVAGADPKGACVYNAGSKTHCAVLTQKECNVLNGAWVSGGKCP